MLGVSMFFLLCSLLSIADEPKHDLEIEVTGSRYKDILIISTPKLWFFV